MSRIHLVATLAILTQLLVTARVEAAYANFTAAGAPSATFNGGVFIQGGDNSGTGAFPAFVQISGSGPGDNIREAYNTTVNNTNDNGSSATFNHEIRVSDLLTVLFQGNLYFVFQLDINENNNATDKYLSLDQVKVITSTTANQSSEPLPAGTLRYDMGAGNGILLNFDLEPGSGRHDMDLLIPVGNFAGALPTDFVYLFSQFGAIGTTPPAGAPAGDYGTSDGFEEWALGVGGGSGFSTIPEPASMVAWALGLASFGLITHRRRKVQTAL